MGQGPTLFSLSQFNLNKIGPGFVLLPSDQISSANEKKKKKIGQVTKNDQINNLWYMLRKCLTIAPNVKKILKVILNGYLTPMLHII
jgi:hypothetical protein